MKRIGMMALLMAFAAALAVWTGTAGMERDESAVAAFAAAEENVFALETEPPAQAEFAIEVLGVGQEERKRVLIYHTHTYEAFAQAEGDRYQETEKWRSADSRYNMVRVGEELAALLRSLGVDVVHDTTAFEPPVLSSAYSRSLDMLSRRRAEGETYDLYIDLHRDAYIESQKGPNAVDVNGAKAARLMVLIGNGQDFDEKPNWETNLAIARSITDSLNRQAEGLCREVSVKSGRYNQHAADGCILIEAGNNRNTLQEVLCAMPYLADAICETLGM